MKLSEICVDRPVFTTMMMIAIIVLGGFCYLKLGVDLWPKVDFPNVVITTRFPGAGPEEVESQVTKIIEEAVNTISGIDELRSTSFEGLSQVVIAFKLSRDIDTCSQDVRDRVGRVLGRLPQGLNPPIVEKMDPDAAPVITLILSGEAPMKDLTDYAKKGIKEELESLNGVGAVTMLGGRFREISIQLDGDRLNAFNLTPAEVRLAVQRQNVELPGGLVETGSTDLVLRTMGRMKSVPEFEEIILNRRPNGSLIYLRDVATVIDGEAPMRSVARLNGANAISLVVQKQSGTNTVAVVEEVKKKLDQLRVVLPTNMRLVIARDQSLFILGSFHAVREHLILGAILASLMVLLFLGDFRSTVIAAIAIPTSVVATFILMYWQGFSLNQMSLLGLTLSVGLVIDDAIVVLENIFRHMGMAGKSPADAAKSGTSEIALAVLATTLSLVVIFLPVAFMPGIIGRFFMSFGLTLAFAVLVSMFISFTLTPMLCSRWLKRSPGQGTEEAGFSGWLDHMLGSAYVILLGISMRNRWLVFLLGTTIALSTIPIAKIVKKDFIPFDDQSEFIVSFKGVEGTSIHETLKIIATIETKLLETKGVAHVLSSIGEQAGAAVNEGQLYVKLVPIGERNRTQFDYMNETRLFLHEQFPHLKSSVGVVPLISGGGFKQMDLILSFKGADLEKLRSYSGEVLSLLANTPGVVDLDSSLNLGKPEIRVELDRHRAANQGVDLLEVAAALRTLVGGDEEQLTKFKDTHKGEEYEVRVRLKEEFRDQVTKIGDIPIRSRSGTVKLSSIATIVQSLGPTQIDRYNRQRQVGVFANLQGIGLGEAQYLIDEKLKNLRMEPGYEYTYLGRSKVMKEQNYGFLLAFALSSIFVYLILGGQFESFIHPFTILLSMPLSVPFGILSLILMNEKMHLYSTLGLFMLFGIVKKNAILQIDYTNTLRERGMERGEAILEANRTRLRPILMTTLTLVAGMLPMLFGQGPGSGSRRAMAIVIVGGQSLCLLITLLITPVVYSLFDDFINSAFIRWLFGLEPEPFSPGSTPKSEGIVTHLSTV